jgi:hypothetical protein
MIFKNSVFSVLSVVKISLLSYRKQFVLKCVVEIVAYKLENPKNAPGLSENMKYCPTCQTEYDEEILRFCTKDGAALVDESQPNFTELPSVSAEAEADDFSEETVIRKDKPAIVPPPPPEPEDEFVADTAVEPIDTSDAPRIVIPTREQKREQNVRPKTTAYYPPPAPPKSNTALVVVTTILLTLIVLGGIAGLFWAFGGKDSNTNVNINTSPPENLNVNINSNALTTPTPFDFNGNSLNLNFNSNINSTGNTNLKTPTPTRTSSPSPSPSASVTASPTASPETTPRPTLSPTAPRLPTPTPTPRTPPSGAPATPATNQ